MLEEYNKCETREAAISFLAIQSTEQIKKIAKELSIPTSGNREKIIERVVDCTKAV